MKKIITAFIMAMLMAVLLCACANVVKNETSAEETQESIDESIEETIAEDETTENVTPAEETASSQIEAPHMEIKDFPVMDGSTANLPLARMLYRLCTGATEFTAQENVQFTTTNNCYMRLMDGEADIVIAYEAGPDAKADERFKNLDIKPIGLDALVFLCNEGNPVESLTEKQLQDIYTGKTKNWKELGGENIEIIPFQRTLNSGSQTLMQNLVLRDKQFMDAPTELRPGEMGDLLDYVAEYNNKKNAIGYSVYYYVNNMYMVPGIRLMKVNGVMPDNDTIRSGKYPYVNSFYVAVRKDMDKTGNAYKIFKWLSGEDGQSLIDETGYVSIDGGGKKLPRQYADDSIEFKTSTPFAINSTLFDELSGVIVFGENLKPEKRYMDIRLPDYDYQVMYSDLIAAELPIDSTDNVEETDDYYYVHRYTGLFNVKTGKWTVEPEYQEVFYDYSNPDSPHFVMDRPTGKEWGSGGTLDYYDKSGELIKSVGYNNEDEKWEYIGKYTWADDEDKRIYDNEEETVLLGGNSYFVNSYGEEKVSLYIDGEKVSEGDHGYVAPYSSPVFIPFRQPYGWTNTNISDYDEKWNPVKSEDYIVNEKGALIAGFKTSWDELLVFNARDYAVFNNASGYEVVDMEANKIYSWTTPRIEY